MKSAKWAARAGQLMQASLWWSWKLGAGMITAASSAVRLVGGGGGGGRVGVGLGWR